MFLSPEYIYEPDYFIVARVMNIRRIHKYKLDESAGREEVILMSDVSNDRVATGHLIDAIAIPNNDLKP